MPLPALGSGGLPCGSRPLLPMHTSARGVGATVATAHTEVAWAGQVAPENGGHQGRDPGPTRLSLPGLQQLQPLGVMVGQGLVPRCSMLH